MDEETNVNEVDANGMEADYVGVIEDLKRNTVPKDDYLKLKAENKRLLSAYANGERLPEYERKAEPRDIGEMRRELFGREHSNLEFVSGALELRDEIMERGGEDPFLPHGSKLNPTQQDIEAAERVASVFRECVEYADGDSQAFTNELMRRTIDSAPMVSKRRRK